MQFPDAVSVVAGLVLSDEGRGDILPKTKHNLKPSEVSAQMTNQTSNPYSSSGSGGRTTVSIFSGPKLPFPYRPIYPSTGKCSFPAVLFPRHYAQLRFFFTYSGKKRILYHSYAHTTHTPPIGVPPRSSSLDGTRHGLRCGDGPCDARNQQNQRFDTFHTRIYPDTFRGHHSRQEKTYGQHTFDHGAPCAICNVPPH